MTEFVINDVNPTTYIFWCVCVCVCVCERERGRERERERWGGGDRQRQTEMETESDRDRACPRFATPKCHIIMRVPQADASQFVQLENEESVPSQGQIT